MKTLVVESNQYSKQALDIYRSIGSVSMYDPCVPLRNCPALVDADVIVVRLEYHWDRELLAVAQNLKYIVTPTTGLDHIDMACAAEQGIEVVALKGEVTYLDSIVATAELTWGLLLSLKRNIFTAWDSVAKNEWKRDLFVGSDLRGKTIGILGCGRIGRKIANYAEVFGMTVIAHDIRDLSDLKHVRPVSKVELFEQSDVISIHLPLEENTIGFVDATCIELMKPTAVLVNTSRGKIIDDCSLLTALENGKIAGAALDVLSDELEFSCEENVSKHPLISYAKAHSNLLITPHIGGASVDAMRDTEVFVARKLKRQIEKGIASS